MYGMDFWILKMASVTDKICIKKVFELQPGGAEIIIRN